MIGIPFNLATRDDWLQTQRYVLDENSSAMKKELYSRLSELKKNKTMMVLKNGSPTDSEQQTPEHFESVIDLASAFVCSGLSDVEIESMMEELK